MPRRQPRPKLEVWVRGPGYPIRVWLQGVEVTSLVRLQVDYQNPLRITHGDLVKESAMLDNPATVTLVLDNVQVFTTNRKPK